MALTNKALTGPCCNVLLCGPSALSTLTERFSYTRQISTHRMAGINTDSEYDYIKRKEGGKLIFSYRKRTTTSPGSHTTSSFMNRHTTRARVT